MPETYDEIRSTYSCALPTEQELKDFFANLNMYLAIEDHVGPKGTQKNLVCYFTPFTGKFLNYVRCFDSFHKENANFYHNTIDHKPRWGKPFTIYTIMVSDYVPQTSYWEYRGCDVAGGNMVFKCRSRVPNTTRCKYPMSPAGKYFNDCHGLNMHWGYFEMLSETDARRGFSILSRDLNGNKTFNYLFDENCTAPKASSYLANYLYPLMELHLGDPHQKIFAKSSNTIYLADPTASSSTREFQLKTRPEYTYK